MDIEKQVTTPGAESQPVQPQAGETTNAETPPQAGSDDTKKPTRSPEDFESEIAKLRKESAAYRNKDKELDQLKADTEVANLNDLEKAQKRATAAEQQAATYRDRIASQEVRLRALEKGFADPTDAMDMLRTSLQYDDDGMPKDLDDALDALLKAKPYLKRPEAAAAKAAPSSGGATNPSKSTTSQAQPITWDLIAKLTPAQYDERRNEIFTFIQKNPAPRK